MSFASSAAVFAASDVYVSQYNPTLQMFEDFLEPFRVFSQALNAALRAPAPVFAYADWRPASLTDAITRAPALARLPYAKLDASLHAEIAQLARELDCKAVAAIVMIRRQQRNGMVQDLAFIEACRRAARGLGDCIHRFEAALDPLVSVGTIAKPKSQPNPAPNLELVTNVTLG